MTALRNTLVGGLTLLALLVALPAPVRASWVECESTAPGELRVGVLLVPGQDELDPAIGSIVWRTVGPTEKVFYTGPKLNFGMTISELLPGEYSIVYEYRGSDGDSEGRFCSVVVSGSPAPSPTRSSTTPEGRTDQATSSSPRATMPASTDAPATQPRLVVSEPLDEPSAPVAITSAIDPIPSGSVTVDNGSPLVLVGLLCIGLAALLAFAARPRRR